METTRFAVQSVHIDFPPSLRNFTLGKGHAFDPAQFIDNNLLSLFCFDDENRRAIFVELPEDVDLTQAPICL